MAKFKIRNFIWIILAVVSVGSLIISSFHLSNVILYIADASNICLFIYSFKYLRKCTCIEGMNAFFVCVAGFSIFAIIGAFINGVPVHLFLWGGRNFYRYLLFFYSCVVYLRKEHVYWFFEKLPIIYWINLVLSLFQYFVLHLGNDYIGGIFGISQGCNGATTIFLNISLAYFVSQYINKAIKFSKLSQYLVVYFVITVIAEIKGNFIFFVLIIAVELIAGRKSLRTIGIGIGSGIALVLGIFLLAKLFPESVGTLLNPEQATNYMNATYFGRATFTRNAIFQVANNNFFEGDLIRRLLGFGLGACEVSAFFVSPFYASYGYMNYRQYSMAMMLLQNGYIGLALYLLMFVMIAIVAFRNCERNKDVFENAVCLAVVAIAIFSILDNIYATLFVDMGYWLWFIFAIPFVLIKERRLLKNEN